MTNLKRLKMLMGRLEHIAYDGDSIHISGMGECDNLLLQWLFENGGEILDLLGYVNENFAGEAQGRANDLFVSLSNVGKEKDEVDWCKLWHCYKPICIFGQYLTHRNDGSYVLQLIFITEIKCPEPFYGKTYQDCYRQACKHFKIEPGV